MQGGLEIACEVVARMPATIKNHMIMDRYLEMVHEFYAEPENEVVLGSFLKSIQDLTTNKIVCPLFNKGKGKMRRQQVVEIET